MTRLENIATKLTDEERTQKTIQKMMIDDVWKDFNKAEEEKVVKAAAKMKGKIMPLMTKQIIKLYEEYSAK